MTIRTQEVENGTIDQWAAAAAAVAVWMVLLVGAAVREE